MDHCCQTCGEPWDLVYLLGLDEDEVTEFAFGEERSQILACPFCATRRIEEGSDSERLEIFIR